MNNNTSTVPEQVKDNFYVFPLSFQQESLWFLDQLEPRRSIYNIPLCLKITGKLQQSILEKSLHIMIQRHEVLRTSFGIHEDKVSQVVSDNYDFKINYTDLTNIDTEDNLKKAIALANEEVRLPFDLSVCPMFRCRIIKLDEDLNIIVFTFHHILFDGWSTGIFLSELGTIYSQLIKGENPLADSDELQFADFTVWQREWFESEAKATELEFWKKELENSNTLIELPTDFIRPDKLSYNGDFETIELNSELVEKLNNLSRSNGSTLFMTLLAALKVLAFRYSGQNDVLIASPVSIRNSEELENLIGFYVNTVVFRSNVEKDISFSEFLKKVREKSLSVLENQNIPFDKLVEEIQPVRNLGQNPLFQIMFALQTMPEYGSNFVDLNLQPIQLGTKTSKFDLLMELKETSGKVKGFIEYSTDLFKKETIDNLILNFLTLLQGIVADPDMKIKDLPLLNNLERKKVLHEWNQTEIELPEKINLIELFEKTALKEEDKIAVQSGKKELSYSELNERVNQLAHYLINSGVKQGDYIGVCIDRSVEMLVAMLAVLKAGAAYVPMDPIFPVERLGYMIEDAEISVVITEGKLENIFKDFTGTKILVDKESEEINAEHKENPGIIINPDQLAYVIFTSGSTGRPKGVQLEHRPVINFLLSMQKEPGLSSEDTLLSVTTISFDISVLELFLPLITGAKLIIADKTTASDGKLLIREIKEKAVTVMQATPSTWKLMIEAGWKRSPGLKMLCGGEALPLELAKQMLERGRELWNMYGPTETTVWSSVKRIEPEDDVIFIGPPIANTQFYIVDEHLNPVPIGVPGELLIGGDGLARGYLNRDDLTEEKFIKNPFIEGGLKVYRTGDLARFKNNGDIEFLGRIDNQVKIRGFRIELGEIEKVLSGFDGIKDAVVNAWTDNKGDKKLVGYYILDTDEELKLSKIKEYLREELPEYMIPSFFLRLDTFPLTPNNKTDRKALPAPETEEITTEEKYVAPGDEIEKQLAEIWQKVLGVKSVGINDNFFDLGGHSLLAAQLFAQIEKKMQVNLPLALLFQSPTIKQLAKIIRDDEWKTTWQSLVPIKEKGDKPPLFMIHGAEGNVLLYKELANYLPDDQPVYGLQSRGLDGVSEMHTRFEDMAADYIKEIKEVQPSGPYLLGGYCLGGAIAYEIAQQLRDDGREIAVLAMLETFNFHYIKDKIPKYYKYLHTVQNFYFHWENILRAGLKDSTKFLRQKFAVEFSRLKLKLSVLFSSVKERFSSSKSLNFHHLEIVEVNDKAQINYIPKKYDGQVLLFKPKKDYAGFEDEFQGWGELADGRIKIIEVPASPRGMMVDPFVKNLALKLNDEINSRLNNLN